MKLLLSLLVSTMVGTSTAFAQAQTPSSSPVPVVNASASSANVDAQNTERLLIEKLELIENDPIIRKRAEAEAQISLSVFGGS